MKNTIRCCISCILPCGALDVIRIVHSNGRVEEISGTIRASEIMKAHPKHVLKKPSSSSDDGCVPKIVIVPPDAELQRGKIYFLMPVPSSSEKSRSRSSTKKKKREPDANANNGTSMTSLLISDRYLNEILSEKLSTQRDRRRGRVGVWRPHLESICTEGKKKKNNAIVLSWVEIVGVYQPFWQRSRRPIRNHKGCGYRNLDFAELHMTVVNGHKFKTVIFVILRERERKVQKALWGLFAL